MSRASRNKGKRGERELAREFTRIFGVEARRTQQYCGTAGDADLITDIEGLHVECTRVERLQVHKAIHQAIDDARTGEVPAVFSKKNLEPWLVTLRMDDVPEFCRRILAAMGEYTDMSAHEAQVDRVMKEGLD